MPAHCLLRFALLLPPHCTHAHWDSARTFWEGVLLYFFCRFHTVYLHAPHYLLPSRSAFCCLRFAHYCLTTTTTAQNTFAVGGYCVLSVGWFCCNTAVSLLLLPATTTTYVPLQHYAPCGAFSLPPTYEPLPHTATLPFPVTGLVTCPTATTVPAHSFFTTCPGWFTATTARNITVHLLQTFTGSLRFLNSSGRGTCLQTFTPAEHRFCCTAGRSTT